MGIRTVEEMRLQRVDGGLWQEVQVVIVPPPPPLPDFEPTWKCPSMIHGSDLPNVRNPYERVEKQGVVLVQGKGDEAQINYLSQADFLSGASPIRCEMMSGGYAFDTSATEYMRYWPERGLSWHSFAESELSPRTSTDYRAKVLFWESTSAMDMLVRGITARLDAVKERGNQALMLDNTSHPSARPERPWGKTLELLTRCRDAAHERGLLLFTNMATHFCDMSFTEIDQLADAADLMALEQWWRMGAGAPTLSKYERFGTGDSSLAFIPQMPQSGVPQPVSWRDEARFAAGIAHCLGNALTWCYINWQESWGWDTGAPVAEAVLTDTGVGRAFANGTVSVSFASRTASFIGRSETEDG